MKRNNWQSRIRPVKLVIFFGVLAALCFIGIFLPRPDESEIEKRKLTEFPRFTWGKQRRKKFMKSTGIVRKVDELGRIVLPIEMRRTLDIAEKDALEIYVEGENIILRKYQASCIFCDNVKGVIQYRGKNVCPDCINKLKAKL